MTKNENWASFRNETWYQTASPLKQAVAELAYLYAKAKLTLGFGRKVPVDKK